MRHSSIAALPLPYAPGRASVEKGGQSMHGRKLDHSPCLGSLCTGYGGLDMVLQQGLDARLAWVADNDRHLRKPLTERLPAAPTLGDVRAIDSAKVDPVALPTAGFPLPGHRQ